MLFIPLPFVITLLMLVLLYRLYKEENGFVANKLFMASLLGYTFLSALIGIRWGYEIKTLLPLQSVLAMLWMPTTWLGFRSLVYDDDAFIWQRDWPHGLPTLLVILLIIFWPYLIDVVIILCYCAYAIALWRLAGNGPNQLTMARLEDAEFAYRGLRLTALILLIFAMLDIFISIDMHFLQGVYSPKIITFASLPTIILIGYIAAKVARVRPTTSTSEKKGARVNNVANATADDQENKQTDVFDQQLIDQIERLMKDQQLYKDSDLNLARLARKSGHTTRKVSTAINRIKGKNVSQYVNEYRINEICRLLLESDRPVTELMLEAGFLTKSNFNREFQKAKQLSPKQWRERHQP